MSAVVVLGLGCVLAAWPVALAQGLGEHRYSLVTGAEAWQAVASELRRRGFGPEELPRVEDLELPVAVPAWAGRTLQVSSVCWDRDAAHLRFRLECRPAGACLRFLAYLRGGVEPGSHAQAPSCRLEGSGHLSTPPQRATPSVEAGQRATATLSGSGLHMTAAVTCLERGAEGEIVRVRGQEGRIFRARVAGRALVEALPE